MGAALLLGPVACGANSPANVADAADGADASTILDAADASAILDAAAEPEVDGGHFIGGFFCTDPTSYFVEVKASGGKDLRLTGSCDKPGSGAARFGVARGGLTLNPGAIAFSICGAQAGGANLALSSVLPNYNGGSAEALATWNDGSTPDAAGTSLQGSVDITRVGAIGDTLEGTYTLSSSSLALSGSFRVCHLYDDDLGPPPP